MRSAIAISGNGLIGSALVMELLYSHYAACVSDRKRPDGNIVDKNCVYSIPFELSQDLKTRTNSPVVDCRFML